MKRSRVGDGRASAEGHREPPTRRRTGLGESHHGSTTLDACRQCADFELRLAQPGVRRWAVGVTTAPRPKPTLGRALCSLAAAGWAEPRLFADGGSLIPPQWGHLPTTRRDSLIGAWPNFLLGLAELYLREPQADAYMMVQDDVVWCRNVRAMLERTLWPAEQVGVVSPYCPQPYDRREAGWHPVRDAGRLAGAVTLVFPNAAARLLLASLDAVNHRLRPDPHGRRLIDGVVGRWCQRVRLPAFFHWPSLGQHIGHASAVWPGGTIFGNRRATSFPGEDFDAIELTRQTRRQPRELGGRS